MTRRERVVLVAGGILVLASLAFRLCLVGAGAWSTRVASVERKLAMLEALRQTLLETDELGRQADSLKQAFVGLDSLILNGGTEAEAAASLAAHLALAADRSGTVLLETSVMPDSAIAGRLRRITMSGSLSGDNAGLARLLRALIGDPVVLDVRQLRFEAPNPASSGAQAEVINGDLTVSGWYLAREEP